MKPAKFYEFPNGLNTAFRAERYTIAESMFNPKFIIKVMKYHSMFNQFRRKRNLFQRIYFQFNI